MENRILKLRHKMNSEGLDGVLVFNPQNRRYLSGFTGTSGYLLITQNKKILITDFRYTEQAKRQTDYEIIESKESIIEILKECIQKNKVKNLGIEEDYITFTWYRKLSEKISVNFTKVDEILKELRKIKDNIEIQNIRKAVEIGEKSFLQILDIIKPDISEKEVALELEYILRKNGAEGISFDTIVASGKNSSLPHAYPTDKKIENGDFVVIDFGCKYKGYCSDMTRTIIVGNSTNEQKKIYDIVLEAQKRALEYIASGKKGSDVDKIARNHITENGYGNNFGHSLGHGVGLNIHEAPTLSVQDENVLRSGMVVTVEPGIYIENFGGVRIEDMVIIKNEGVENLMKISKNLLIV